MIDQLEPATTRRLPVSPGIGRALVLLCVFVCAACGLVYELELVAVAGYLTGDTITQTSVVLSVMVFAMGLGSLLAKRWRCRPAVGFAVVEVLLSLVGGLSVMALYAAFAWFGQSRVVLVVFSLAIGVLIGAEVPLLMTLIQRIRRQDAGGAVADLFAADYVGALVGGLAFPFLLLPWLGQLTGALLTGAVNAVAGGALVVWLFRHDLTHRTRALLVGALATALVVLSGAALCAGPFERAARQAVYDPQVRLARQTDVQEVVVTGAVEAPRIFLDGRLRVDAADEYRYHEALVHPAMAGPHRRVLVLGGGDGLAVREVLRWRGVRSVTVVDIDPDLVALARTDPGLAALNDHAHDDPRVRHVVADAFGWLRARRARADHDVVIADLPDPAEPSGGRLYSREFYGLARRAMAPGARLVIHAGSPSRHPRTFWTVESTVRSAGLRTVPYRVGTASSAPGGDLGGRDWGLVLASRGRPVLTLAPSAPPLRFLSPVSLREAARAARAGRPDVPPQPSTLIRPRYLD